ncbi:MAG: HAMP domain-containing histidine kinase [Paracoccaceae bacterium]|nr:HAMP domain-containing histidine kinase [Paracoccaceae bacterium]
MFRRRLYAQIYLTVIISLVIVVILTAILWGIFGRDAPGREALNVAGRLATASLPPADAPRGAQRAALIELGHELDISITLFDADRRLIAATGRMGPPPPRDQGDRGWNRVRGTPAWAFNLPDGRWLVIDPGRHRQRKPFLNLALLLAAIALGVALGAYPLVRRLTRRLERLQEGVERIGKGDLSARVEVKGRDEVARLATSFNEAAAKIETLLGAHRMLLANASHELRTPLARIRLGAEMLKEGSDGDERRAALRQDIAELDALIDEILLMSRLDAGSQAELAQSVDLLALAAEEAAHYPDCSLIGWAPEIAGDPTLLRRLIRNLVENAYKHGRPPVAIHLARDGGEVTLTVTDGGDGIPESERENVFQPFYRASTKQNVAGYGLGLPLVRQIAEIHGGTVQVLTSGSGVRVGLPVRPGVEDAPAP